MTKGYTPEIEVTDNSTSILSSYLPTVTKSITPAITNVKANTNLTITYRP